MEEVREEERDEGENEVEKKPGNDGRLGTVVRKQSDGEAIRSERQNRPVSNRMANAKRRAPKTVRRGNTVATSNCGDNEDDHIEKILFEHDALIVLQHEKVITLGAGSTTDNLKFNIDERRKTSGLKFTVMTAEKSLYIYPDS